MITINYKGTDYKCEITSKDSKATRIRVFDTKGVGNLYIWTNGYDSPRPYKYNKSKLIVKNVVLLAFEELAKEDVVTQPLVAMTVLPEEKPAIVSRERKPRADRFA